MKYKIYRYRVTDSEIFVDLYNEPERRNLELKFCIYRRARKLFYLINYIEYHYLVHGEVDPADLIHIYESLSRKLDRGIEQND